MNGMTHFQWKVRFKFKVMIQSLISVLGLSTISLQGHASTNYIQIRTKNKVVVDVVRVDDLSKLILLLNDSQQKPLKNFSTISKKFPKCRISFAMNAGMYHTNFAPVGLYIENSKQLKSLNLEQNQFGNFFMQPNGVAAWNGTKALIHTTQQFKNSDFKPTYATQSGPMLVINGMINPNFVKKSDSLKIRNGVGVKNNQLYFVISRGRISFYDFADIFKTKLNIDQALYLDGSISSAFIPQVNRNDQIYELGPMFVYDESQRCYDS